jgi:transposase
MLPVMKTYCRDLREKMLAAEDVVMSKESAVSVFGVSSSTLKRWLRRRRETGDV